MRIVERIKRGRNPSIDELSKIIGPIAEVNNIVSVSLFGSRATGKYTRESDYDFLIDVNENYTFRNYCKFTDGVEAALGRPIDVVERQLLTDDIFSRRVQREEIHVWG